MPVQISFYYLPRGIYSTTSDRQGVVVSSMLGGQRERGREGGKGGGLSLERRYAGRGQTFDTVRTNERTRSLALLRLVFISRLDSNVFL